jgi:hypothetical protein
MAEAIRQAASLISDPRLSLADIGTVPSRSTPSHSWQGIDLIAFDETPPAEPSIAGLCYPGLRHHISGEPESLKTWLVLVLCTGELQAGNTVVYIDLENGAQAILARLRDLGLADELIQNQFVYIGPREPIGTPGVRDDLDRMLAVLEPTLVVVDSMAGALALHDQDPNSARDVEKFAQAVIEPLRSQGAAVMTLDHVPKNRDNRGRFATGSERKIGVTDVHLGIETLQVFGRGRSGRAKIVVHKDRHGWLPRPKAAELELVSDPDSHRITYEILLGDDADECSAAQFRPTTLMERVSIYVEGVDEPVSRNLVESAVKGKREYVRLALDVLRIEGYVHEEHGPRGARLVSALRPFRESQDDLAPTSPRPRPGDETATSPDLASPRPPLQEGGEVSETAEHKNHSRHDDLAPGDVHQGPQPGDITFPDSLLAAGQNGHITEAELNKRFAIHERVVQGRSD